MAQKRGNIRPGKVKKNIRIYGDLWDNAVKEAPLRGLDSGAAMLNFILNDRYYGPNAIDMNALRQKGKQ